MIDFNNLTNKLFDSISDLDEQKALQYIRDGAHLDWTFTFDKVSGISALHNAAMRGLNIVAKAILAAGDDVNKVTSAGMTPFHYAAANGNVEVLRTLQEHGAKANICTNEQVTALHYATQYGHFEAVRFLLKLDPTLLKVTTCTGDTPISYAVKFVQPKILSYFVNNYTSKDILNTPNLQGNYPLHQLITCFDEPELNKSLIEILDAGANPRLTNSKNKRPSQLAEDFDHEQATRILREREFPLFYLCSKKIIEDERLCKAALEIDLPENIKTSMEEISMEINKPTKFNYSI